jgi:hypothetical protein
MPPLVLTRFMDGDNVGVLQIRRCFGLGPKRCRHPPSQANRPGRIIFTATTRFRLTCRAL